MFLLIQISSEMWEFDTSGERMCTSMDMLDNLLCTLIHVHGHGSFATLGTILVVFKFYLDVFCTLSYRLDLAR